MYFIKFVFTPLLFFYFLLAQQKAIGLESLEAIINSTHRTAEFVSRDQYRHPFQTLQFFDVKSDMVVVEIWPSGGWYAEILAPYLKPRGLYYAVGFSLTAKRTPAWRKAMAQRLLDQFQAKPNLYDKAVVTALAIPEDVEIAPPATADRVLTFRNVHNWMKGGYAREVFVAMYNALKSGGILGVVEHRARPGTSAADMIASGYVTESYVKKLAQSVGFEFMASSEINANPKDSKDHPKGVWTLPPSLRLKSKDRDKYLAIGESDRMTVKFIKP